MKQPYTCIIVDDEPKAIEQLDDMITGLYDSIHIEGRHLTWKTAFEALKEAPADIVFLDIAMPQKTGIALLRLLPQLESEVIFVTADPTHALDAFDVGAAGYVLKPLDDCQFKKCVDKALEHIAGKRLAKKSTMPAPETVRAKIGIPNDGGLEYVNVEDILFIEGALRYTRVRCTDRDVLSSYSIGRFREVIGSDSFFQAHRSFIINLNFVLRYDSSGLIVMKDGSEIPVTKNVRTDFLNLFRKISR